MIPIYINYTINSSISILYQINTLNRLEMRTNCFQNDFADMALHFASGCTVVARPIHMIIYMDFIIGYKSDIMIVANILLGYCRFILPFLFLLSCRLYLAQELAVLPTVLMLPQNIDSMTFWYYLRNRIQQQQQLMQLQLQQPQLFHCRPDLYDEKIVAILETKVK